MCAKKDTVRRIMMTAHRLGMVQTGEYVFINVELTTGYVSIFTLLLFKFNIDFKNFAHNLIVNVLLNHTVWTRLHVCGSVPKIPMRKIK